MTRRARGDGGLHWNDKRQRWIATAALGYDGRGKRISKKASGGTKTEAKDKLRALLRDHGDGLAMGLDGYTVRQAVEDWLTYGLARDTEATITKYRYLCDKHITPHLGARRLRDLSATEVDGCLAEVSKTLSKSSTQRVRGCVNRAVRRAMARDLVKRNVVELTEVPGGQQGRPSKSLTPSQADGVLVETRPDRLHNYIVVALLTGARTEELRALDWDHVHLEERPPYVEVWRSVRQGGDTKTRKSNRTLALPELCVEALRRQRAQQAAERLAAGDKWQDTGLAFTTAVGTAMDAANVRREFRRALRLVPDLVPGEWTPRELRHSFVSLLSNAGVPLEHNFAVGWTPGDDRH